MEKGLVSVVIPTNKGADVIGRTIESVLQQSYKNIEIIIIDDNGAGTEEQRKTENIVNQYVNRGRILYKVLEKHKNGSYARNQGFGLSKGEYISYLDDDDLFFIEKIEVEVNAAIKNKSDMVICGAYFVNNNRIGFVEKPRKGKHFLYDYLMGKYYFNTSTLLINRKVVENLDGFDDRFYRHQDWEFCTRIISKYNVTVIPNPMVIKIMNPRNYVTNPDKVAEYAEFLLKERKEYIDSLGSYYARRIYEHHYCRVALAYLSTKNFKKAADYFKRCKMPVYCATATIIHRGLQGIEAILTHRNTFSEKELEYLV